MFDALATLLSLQLDPCDLRKRRVGLKVRALFLSVTLVSRQEIRSNKNSASYMKVTLDMCVCVCVSLLSALISINVSKTCVIAGFYRGVNFFTLLRCYEAYVGGYRRFGTTHRFHLQWLSSPDR